MPLREWFLPGPRRPGDSINQATALGTKRPVGMPTDPVENNTKPTLRVIDGYLLSRHSRVLRCSQAKRRYSAPTGP